MGKDHSLEELYHIDEVDVFTLELKKALKRHFKQGRGEQDVLRNCVKKACSIISDVAPQLKPEIKSDLVLAIGYWARWGVDADIERVRECLENLVRSEDRHTRAVACSAFGFLFYRVIPEGDYFVWDSFVSSLKGDGFEKTAVLFGLHNAIINEELVLTESGINALVGLTFGGEQDIREDASSVLAMYSPRAWEYLGRFRDKFESSISTEISSRVTENLRLILDNLG